MFLQNNVAVVQAVVAHLSDDLSVPVITVQEVWDGWAAAISRAKTPDQVALGYARLTETLNELRNWSLVSFSIGAVARYLTLKKQKLNVGSGDLKIASIAIESGATVVTRNRRDFVRIPGAKIVDWSAS
ncbi:type II toxin-antitoxin system VapC family toxin [Gemmata sp. G18]|uniref:Type II toxin-antitoxin system VapC family toxin n=1 Tax=Gemmata palustris TaxID=2822762 RepID=A0ABS5BK03_9BACT|nr:type II toxin-antitoxin system VapC family toxin [Gemmata palustris]